MSFRREKYVANGGPDGGDGGNGGSVIFEADNNLRTLMDFKYKRVYKAESGQDGMRRKRFGKKGQDLIIHVPVGTLIIDKETGLLMKDMKNPGDRLVAAKGGKGGKGNVHFKNSVRQAPNFAEAGALAKERTVILELKLIADVGLLGFPNVGKSTLMNHLIGQKIAITSNKPQTTRNRIQTVYTGPKGQIVFLDTPGIHKAKNKLGNYMVKVAESTFSDVDVILWLVEPTTYIGAGERHILEQLKRSRLPVILVINKIDTVPKTAVLDAMETYRKEMDFAEIVPVSALRSNNTDTLLDCIFKYLPYGEPFYDEDTITDQPQRQIVAEMIREKALLHLREEVPHGIGVEMMAINKLSDNLTEIHATIYCERASHKGIIIGKQGAMLRTIGAEARRDIENLLGTKVNLQLWVKIREDWRNRMDDLRTLGYESN